MRPKHFYHCSSKWLGELFEPKRSTPNMISSREPSTPRLCVCPTIAGCFAARMFDHHRPVFVYRTVKPYRGIHPRDVWDQIATDEHWLIPPVRLIHVATINALHVDEIQRAALRYHVVTRKASSLHNRVAQRAIAYRVVGGPKWEGQLLDRFKRTCEINDPEEFLVGRMLGAPKWETVNETGY